MPDIGSPPKALTSRKPTRSSKRWRSSPGDLGPTFASERKPMTGMKLVGIMQIGFLAQALLAAPASDDSEFVALAKITGRVTVAYWLGGVERRCNLVAIQTRKGLVMIDTEISPGIMAPIKAKLERT